MQMIIDVHTHLPVINNSRTYAQSLEVALKDMRKDDVSYAILIPDNRSGTPIGDLDICLELVEDTPELFVMGTIDVEDHGKEWLAKLEDLMTRKKIVGIKIFPGHDPIYPTDERLFPVYELCQALSTPMVIHTGWNVNDPDVAQYNDPKYIAEIATKYPELSIVIAHFFWPGVDYCYETTHHLPNVSYDISGLADEYVISKTGKPAIQAVLEKTIRRYPDRVLFGTDYEMCDRRQHIDLVNGLDIPVTSKNAVFCDNAVSTFNLQKRVL